MGPWWTRLLCAAGIVAIAGLLHIGSSGSRIGWPYAITLPLSALILDAALIRSVWHTYRVGGVSWRDQVYPLSELRDHVRRRNRSMREAWRRTRRRR